MQAHVTMPAMPSRVFLGRLLGLPVVPLCSFALVSLGSLFKPKSRQNGTLTIKGLLSYWNVVYYMDWVWEGFASEGSHWNKSWKSQHPSATSYKPSCLNLIESFAACKP